MRDSRVIRSTSGDPDCASDRLGSGISTAKEKASVLILGLGNDILTDDAIGLRVAQEVGRRFSTDSRVASLEVMEMGLALLDHTVGFKEVILVDSIQTGERPVGRLAISEASELSLSSATTPHFLGVGETLAFGNALQLDMPRRVQVVSVEVEDPFTLGTTMTPAVEEALPDIVDQVFALTCAALDRVERSAPLRE